MASHSNSDRERGCRGCDKYWKRPGFNKDSNNELNLTNEADEGSESDKSLNHSSSGIINNLFGSVNCTEKPALYRNDDIRSSEVDITMYLYEFTAAFQ
ncbi:hypothetical protein ACF0H5_014738 [Mactra antiquata]